MAAKDRLVKVEKEQGQPVKDLIPALLDRLGTQKAVAEQLGVSQATISTWLRANGYVPVTIWRQESVEK